jgi:predicted Rossmann fold flavoprotein
MMIKHKDNLHFDNIIIGAGAAGLFLAGELNNKKNLIIESNSKPGKKIIISGGGRCNFTNKNITFNDFQSESKTFYRAALKAYTQNDFIDLVSKNNIPFYEKKLGQLFCNNRSKDILQLLLDRISKNQTSFMYETSVTENLIKKENSSFILKIKNKVYTTDNLIVACGGPPMPKIGGSNLSARLANHFNMETIKFRPALVPLFEKNTQNFSGISLPVKIHIKNKNIEDDLLITHKGFSGPAILKLTLWAEIGDMYKINWDPNNKLASLLRENQTKKLSDVLSKFLPARFTEYFFQRHSFDDTKGPHSKKILNKLIETLQRDVFLYQSNEGFNKAEVAKGGVSTKQINQKTMEAKNVKGLYFIGEAIDVTGLLGGYNFQWAWSSAYQASLNLKN